MNLSNSAVRDHFKRFDCVSKLSVWISHELKDFDLVDAQTSATNSPNATQTTISEMHN